MGSGRNPIGHSNLSNAMLRENRYFTMSKILYPSLRLGYVVAPEQLIDPLVKIRSTMDQHSSAIDQATLARFITEGFFLSHVKRMRKLYAERREVFIRRGEFLF